MSLWPLALAAVGLFALSRVPRSNPEFFTDASGVHPMRVRYPDKPGSQDSISVLAAYSPRKAHESKGARKAYSTGESARDTLAKVEAKQKDIQKRYAVLAGRSQELMADYMKPGRDGKKRAAILKEAREWTEKARPFRAAHIELQDTAHQLRQRIKALEDKQAKAAKPAKAETAPAKEERKTARGAAGLDERIGMLRQSSDEENARFLAYKRSLPKNTRTRTLEEREALKAFNGHATKAYHAWKTAVNARARRQAL